MNKSFILNAHQIAGTIWQGALPVQQPWAVRGMKFDLLVTAVPPDPRGYGVPVIHAPLTDDAFGIVKGDWRRAWLAAQAVCASARRKQKVLVCCAEGRNRSGLIVGIALQQLYGLSGAEVIAKIQSRRPQSLTNWHFCEALREAFP